MSDYDNNNNNPLDDYNFDRNSPFDNDADPNDFEGVLKHTENKVQNYEQTYNVAEAATNQFEQDLTQNHVGQGLKEVNFAANVIFSRAIDKATSNCLMRENQNRINADFSNLNTIMQNSTNVGLSSVAVATNEECFKVMDTYAKEHGYEGGIRVGSSLNRVTNGFNDDFNVMNLGSNKDIVVRAYGYTGLDPSINPKMEKLDPYKMSIDPNKNTYNAKNLGEFMEKHEKATIRFDNNAIRNSRNVQQTLREDSVFNALGLSNVHSTSQLDRVIKSKDFAQACENANIDISMFKKGDTIDFTAIEKTLKENPGAVNQHLAAITEMKNSDILNQGKRGSASRSSQTRHSRTQRQIAGRLKRNASASTQGFLTAYNSVKMVRESYIYAVGATDYLRNRSINSNSIKANRLEAKKLKNGVLTDKEEQKLTRYSHKRDSKRAKQEKLDAKREEKNKKGRPARKERRAQRRVDRRQKFSSRTRGLVHNTASKIGDIKLRNGRHVKDLPPAQGLKNIATGISSRFDKIKDAWDNFKKAKDNILSKFARPLQIGRTVVIVALIVVLIMYLVPSAIGALTSGIVQTFNCFEEQDEEEDISVGEKAIKNIKTRTVALKNKGIAAATNILIATPNGFYTTDHNTGAASVGKNGVSVIPNYYNQSGKQISESEFYLTREILQAIQCQSQLDSDSRTFVKQAEAIFDATHEYIGCAQSDSIRFDDWDDAEAMASCTNQQQLYHSTDLATKTLVAFLTHDNEYLIGKNYSNYCSHSHQEHGTAETQVIRFADGHTQLWKSGASCGESGVVVKTKPYGVTAKGNLCKYDNPKKVEDVTLEYYACSHGVCDGHTACGGHITATASFKANTVSYTGEDNELDVANSTEFFNKAYNAIKSYYIEDIGQTEPDENYLDMSVEENVSLWDSLTTIDWEEVYGISFFAKGTGLVTSSGHPFTEEQLEQIREQAPSEAAFQIVNYANSQVGAMYLYGSSRGSVETFSVDLYNYYASKYPESIGSLDAYAQGGFDIYAENIICYDCSSLVLWSINSAVAQGGISCPYSTSANWMENSNHIQEVDKSELLPGDILAYNGHVGIYAGIVDGQPYTIEAAGNSEGVCTTTNKLNRWAKCFRPNP